MGEPTTSLAKVEANKKNGAKSTGPKTEGGKAVVRLNALKHGLLSKDIVIKEGDGKENEAEYSALLDSLVDECKPLGALEEMLIERIAGCYWKLRRATRLEIGSLRQRLDRVTGEEDATVKWLEKDVNILTEYERLVAEEQSAIGANENCISMLKKGLDISQPHEAKDIDMVTYYEKLIAEEYTTEYTIDPDLDADKWTECEYTVPEMHDFLMKKGRADKELREKFIQQDLAGVEECKRRIRELGNMKKAVELRLSRLPYTKGLDSLEQLETIQRYETTVERQLYRAMNQLERLQRLRGGEVVPPPISVEVHSESS